VRIVSEDFTVIALPRSADPERDFHVSLFITPRLTPGGPSGKLSQFAHFKQWPDAVAGAEIRLLGGTSSDGTGGKQIAATPLLGRLRPELWPKVFPGSTKVKGRPQPEVPQTVLSYPAHKIDEDALHLHTTALIQEPVDLPRPLGDGFRPMVERQLPFAPDAASPLDSLALDRLLEPGLKLQGAYTKELLGHAAALQPGAGLEAGLQPGGFGGIGPGGAPVFYARSAVVSVPGGFDEQLLDAHQARIYYEKLAPPPDTAVPSPAPPDPDFHERCALLAGSSRLLRWLGLVVDLRVDDLEALRTARWIRGRIEIEGLGAGSGPEREPRTACHARGATGFFATPAGDDWSDGWLRLNHPDGRFTVLDLDPDASALNVERHWRNLVRLAAAERNGEEVSAAPPVLRSAGFSIARNRRAEALAEHLDRASKSAAAREQGQDEPLALEDVTRGLRLEAWDDVSGAWRSLHERRLEVEVDGEQVADNQRDVGYLKGGTLAKNVADEDAPEQLHEVIAGWEGWSLSAPPPGKTILPDGKVEEPQPQPGQVAGSPVVIRSRVQRGTLPRLRYGRSYAFRAATVDLAGNSPPHSLGPAPEPSQELLSLIGPLLEARAVAVGPTEFARELLSHFRERRPQTDEETAPGVRGVGLEALDITGEPAVDRLLAPRAAKRAEARLAIGSPRLARVERAFTDALHETDLVLAPTASDPDVATVAALIHRLLDALAVVEEMPEVVERYLDFVTKPRPFLRWDPVLPPTVVPRHPFSAGESLLTLVIRSGVEVSDEEEVEVVAAGDYAEANPGYGYRATSERHLAAPKTSQREAELHGRFDEAIAAGNAKARREALAIALRESGTFLDTEIADLAKPGKTVAQSGVSVVGAADGDGTAPMVERGEPLPRGHYVIHDVDQPVLPYLADPLAAGVSLVFPDAGADHRLEFPWSVEGLRLDYRGDWPEFRPYRLVLESAEELEGRVDGNAIRIALPPGTQLRLRTSSALDRSQLELLGLWRTRPEEYRTHDEIAEAAADGWLWWLTPFDEVRLVHAVPRPIEAPRAIGLEPSRHPDDTGNGLQGVVDLHGPSTGRVDLEASWNEPLDDLTADGPAEVAGAATPWGTEVAPEEDFLALLPMKFLPATRIMPDGDVVHLHEVRHEFGDTKHRVVDYRVRATTRFREHFQQTPALTTDDLSVVGPTTRVSVPNSARPPKPVVRDVLPLFRWQERTEPEQPFALRRTRRAGVRIYFERPWYATGEGELLGLVLGPPSGDPEPGTVPTSIWAADPIWKQSGPFSAESLPLRDLLEILEPDLAGEPGRPARAPAHLPVVDVGGGPKVTVLGYRPEYNPDRKLWFADVTFDQRTAFWPFVRLALARYQPESIEGKHLSPVVTSDFAQLAPDRIATLSRPGDREVRVVVTGPVGYPREIPNPILAGHLGALTPLRERVYQSRTIRARLERRDPGLDRSDLGWATVTQTDLELRGLEDWTASWVGTLQLPQALAPRRPGSRANWRVTVEEWERLHADTPARQRGFRSEARLVYADHLYI
jgi:hypothetical protein